MGKPKPETGKSRNVSDFSGKLKLLGVLLIALRACLPVVSGEGLQKDKKPSPGALQMYFAAARRGDVDAVKGFLAAGIPVDIRESKYFGGGTALINASRRLKLDVVKLLLEKGADIDAGDGSGRTALVAACGTVRRRESPEVVSFLVSKGASPDGVSGKSGTPPLIAAINAGNVAAAIALLELGADPNIATGRATPLNLAIKSGWTELAKKLLDAGAKGAAPRLAPCLSGLVVAVEEKNRTILEYMFAKGFDPNHSSRGMTPIISAATKGDLGMVSYLISKGADINFRNEDGDTVLHILSKTGKADTLVELIKLGADPNVKNGRGETPLMLANTLRIRFHTLLGSCGNIGFAPCANDKEERTEEEKRKHLAELKKRYLKKLDDIYGREDVSTLKALLENGAEIDAENEDGRTALQRMIRLGMSRSCEFLIERGADVNHRDRLGRTPLMDAERWGNKRVVDALLKAGADKSAKDREGRGLEYYRDRAFSEEDLEKDSGSLVMPALYGTSGKGSVGALVRHDKKPLSKAEKERLRLEKEAKGKLFKAAAENDVEVLSSVLASKLVEIDTENADGATALNVAVEHVALESAERLLAGGADPNHALENGVTPLAAAVEGKHAALLKLLLENGAEVFAALTSEKSRNYATTPFVKALLKDNFNVAELLLKHGADINVNYNKNLSILAAAAYGYDRETTKFLVDHGADLKGEDDLTEALALFLAERYDEVDYSATDEQGSNLLIFAVSNGDIDGVDILLSRGLDVNSRNNRGAGVLFAAVYAMSDDSAEPELLSALLGRGADPRARSKSGKSCLDVINEMIESVNAKIEAGQRLTASLSEKEKVELEKNVAEILAPFEKAKAILEAAIEHRKGKGN